MKNIRLIGILPSVSSMAMSKYTTSINTVLWTIDDIRTSQKGCPRELESFFTREQIETILELLKDDLDFFHKHKSGIDA